MQESLSSRASDDININEVQTVTRPQRIVEMGYIPHPEPIAIAIYSEKLPVWLLAINRNQVAKIIIKGHEDLTALLQHIKENCDSPSIFNQIVTKIGHGKCICEVNDVTSIETLCLISGSVLFLNMWHAKLKLNKCIFITDEHRVFRKLPKSDLVWSRIKHVQTGGVTSWESLYSSTNIVGYAPK